MKKNAQWYHWTTFLPIFVFRDCLGYALLAILQKNIGTVAVIPIAVKDFLRNKVRKRQI